MKINIDKEDFKKFSSILRKGRVDWFSNFLLDTQQIDVVVKVRNMSGDELEALFHEHVLLTLGVKDLLTKMKSLARLKVLYKNEELKRYLQELREV